MSMKVNRLGLINMRKRQSSELFKRAYSHNTNFTRYDGNNIMQESHFHLRNSMIFRALDMLGPLMRKYPKFGSGILRFSEKIFKRSDGFSGSIMR